MFNSRLSAAPHRDKPRILLRGDLARANTRERWLGVLQHAHAEGWQLFSTSTHDATQLHELRGGICEIKFRENASAPGFDLSNLGVPTVLLADCATTLTGNLTSPQVAIDHRAVGELAARHLRAAGFQHYAFLGETSGSGEGDGMQSPSALQWSGFFRQLQRADLPCISQFVEPSAKAPELSSWVARLPRQVAVHCASDELALQLSLACQALGRSIPLDVAVLGVGNDSLSCTFPTVPISSVSLPHHALGLKSAQLLSRLLQGEATPERAILVPPVEVVARASTLTFGDAHPAAQRAIRFMREHAYRGISVQDVLDHAKLSRRSLENHVREVLGHAPHQELVRLRVERASHLLDTSALPLQEIARSCGFSDGRQMSETFRRHLALTPSQYRRRGRRQRRDSERPARKAAEQGDEET